MRKATTALIAAGFAAALLSGQAVACPGAKDGTCMLKHSGKHEYHHYHGKDEPKRSAEKSRIQKIDLNDDGKIDMDEFLAGYEAVLKHRFEKVDKDKDGYLTIDEVSSAYRNHYSLEHERRQGDEPRGACKYKSKAEYRHHD